MPRSRPLALFIAGVLTAVLAPAALASAAPAAAPAAAGAVADAGKAEHDRIVAYWTPERMESAQPRDLVRREDGRVTPAATPKPSKGRPGGGGGSTGCLGGSEVVTSGGSSWPCPDGLVQKLTGKVFFNVGSKTYVCSGAVADDGSADGSGTPGRALVLTAGHCAWDLGTSAFVTNWLFFPDFDSQPTFNATCSNTRYGCWTAQALVVHPDFRTAGAFNVQAMTHDFAFAVVGKGGLPGASTELDAGAADEYQVDTTYASGALTALGYPQAKPYTGADLVYCSGSPFEDVGTSKRTWGLGCKMTGGASGGPWITGLKADGSGGKLVSLNSYKYTLQKDFMYGPKFNDSTRVVHDQAKQLAATVGSITNS